MKPELINLLHRLQSHPDIEGFQNLIITPNGVCSAVHRHGALRFPDLDALEAFAYAPVDTGGTHSTASHELQPGNARSSDPVTMGLLQTPANPS